MELAKRNKVALPVTTVEEARQWFVFRDFPHFVEIFFAISSCLKTADDYELIAYEFGAEMARQHVRYAEVTFSAISSVLFFDFHFSSPKETFTHYNTPIRILLFKREKCYATYNTN